MGTHTYAILQVKQSTIDDVTTQIQKVNERGDYNHMFMEDNCIDMHGIALQPFPVTEVVPDPIAGLKNVLRCMEDGGHTSVTFDHEDIRRLADADTLDFKVTYGPPAPSVEMLEAVVSALAAEGIIIRDDVETDNATAVNILQHLQRTGYKVVAI